MSGRFVHRCATWYWEATIKHSPPVNGSSVGGGAGSEWGSDGLMLSLPRHISLDLLFFLDHHDRAEWILIESRAFVIR